MRCHVPLPYRATLHSMLFVTALILAFAAAILMIRKNNYPIRPVPSPKDQRAIALLREIGCQAEWAPVSYLDGRAVVIVDLDVHLLDRAITIANSIRTRYHFRIADGPLPKSLSFPDTMIHCYMRSVVIPDGAYYHFGRLQALEIHDSSIGEGVLFDFQESRDLSHLIIRDLTGKKGFVVRCHARAELKAIMLQSTSPDALSGIPIPHNLRRLHIIDFPGDPGEIKRLLGNISSGLTEVWFENCRIDAEIIQSICNSRTAGMRLIFRNLSLPASAYECCRKFPAFYVFENTNASEELIDYFRSQGQIAW